MLSIPLKTLEIVFPTDIITKFPGGGPPDPLNFPAFSGRYLTLEHVRTKQKVHATPLQSTIHPMRMHTPTNNTKYQLYRQFCLFTYSQAQYEH